MKPIFKLMTKKTVPNMIIADHICWWYSKRKIFRYLIHPSTMYSVQVDEGRVYEIVELVAPPSIF
jgi:hypothetical protein